MFSKWRAIVLPTAIVVLVSGCSFAVPSYTTGTADNELLQNAKEQVRVTGEKPAFQDDGSIGCRAAGPVHLTGGTTFTDYIVDALKSDLESAGAYDAETSNVLRVKLNKIDFSSNMGATNWYINAKYTLNGQSKDVSTVYNDRSSFAAVKACNNIAQYFPKAVAAHLRQLYRSPYFTQKMGISPESETSSTSGAMTAEERLERLDSLRQKGLINEEEYKRRREDIVDSL